MLILCGSLSTRILRHLGWFEDPEPMIESVRERLIEENSWFGDCVVEKPNCYRWVSDLRLVNE